MAILDVKWKLSPRELKQFAAIWFPLACAIIGSFVYRGTGSWQTTGIFAGIAALVSVVAFFVPSIEHGVYVGWMVAAFPIGWTISHLLMGFIYYGVITPMGLIMRLGGRDSMGRKFDPARESYWVPHTEPKDKQYYFKQY